MELIHINLNVLIKIWKKLEIINVTRLKVRIIYLNNLLNVFLAFLKIVNKFDEKDEVISHFFKLGLKSDINLYSSIIYQFPSMDSKKYKSYEFPTIEESYFLEKSVSKYEIPQYIQDIPEGFSLFCTLWEASKVKQYMLLTQEEQEKLNIKENFDKKDKENNIDEQIPKNNFCYICEQKFDDYLIHIESKVHEKNLREQNPYFIQSINNTFNRINKFWNNDLIDNISDISNESNEFNESNEEKESNIDEKSKESKKNKEKFPIFSSCISLINNEDLKNEDDDLNNKENIDLNKNVIILDNFDYKCDKNNISKDIGYKKDYSLFKLLKKKRITFDVIRYESPTKKSCEYKRKDYFNYLNKYKTRKLIRSTNVFFQ